MHFIAEPGGVPRLGIARLGIVRGIEVARPRWKMTGLAPVGAAVDGTKVLNPDLAENLDCRDLVKPRGRTLRPEELEQGIPVLTHRFRIGGPLGIFLG